jgi:undecaprenyl-diphosphatase
MAPFSLVSFVVFVSLALAVRYSAALDQADLQAALWVNHLSLGDATNSLLTAASLYGREFFWIPLVVLLLLAGDRRTKLVALGLCGVFLAGIVAGELAKEIVARPRPLVTLAQFAIPQGQAPLLRLPNDADFSFPSGHAVIVTIGAAYSLATFRRRWLAGLLTVEALAVCFSRVYTFQHFPTDVAAGAALGVAIGLGGLAFGLKYIGGPIERLASYLTRMMGNGPISV